MGPVNHGLGGEGDVALLSRVRDRRLIRNCCGGEDSGTNGTSGTSNLLAKGGTRELGDVETCLPGRNSAVRTDRAGTTIQNQLLASNNLRKKLANAPIDEGRQSHIGFNFLHANKSSPVKALVLRSNFSRTKYLNQNRKTYDDLTKRISALEEDSMLGLYKVIGATSGTIELRVNFGFNVEENLAFSIDTASKREKFLLGGYFGPGNRQLHGWGRFSTSMAMRL